LVFGFRGAFAFGGAFGGAGSLKPPPTRTGPAPQVPRSRKLQKIYTTLKHAYHTRLQYQPSSVVLGFLLE